jgi:transposase
MARKRASLDQKAQGKEVLERLKEEPPGRLRERLLAVKLGLEGELSLEQIAGQLSRSRSTIQTWFDAFRRKGIAGLEPSRAPRGFAGALHEEAKKALRQKLAKGSFRRAEDARQWLHKRYRISLSTGRVAVLLGKLGARLKVVRPRHPQSSDHQREQFRTSLARQIFTAMKTQHPDDQWKKRPLRIWIADEARLGLQPCLKRAWVTRGIKAHKSGQIRYQWRYLWAALEVDGEDSVYLYTDGADTDFSRCFLQQISAQDPQSEHVVIWDGAGFHPRGGDEGIPENVTVVRQPPYSPELNCVEKLWDQLRDGLCNRQWTDLAHLLAQATRWLRAFWENPARVRSLVGDDWLLHQANA